MSTFHEFSCRECEGKIFKVIIEHMGTGMFGLSWICCSCDTQAIIIPIEEKGRLKGLIEFDISKGNI